MSAESAELREEEVRHNKGNRWGIVLVLVAAAFLRIWFAVHDLDDGRFWDERYSFRNVDSVLEKGRPDRALYPSLSYLPHTVVLAASEGLHRATGDARFAIYSNRESDRFSPTAYFLSRLVTVAFSVWSIALLYGIGRRVFDPGVALLAALLLATFWRHVRAAGEFKPDSMALAFVLLAFGWSLDAIQQPTRNRFLLVGVGVGLAAAAKYNAAGICIALVVGVLVRDWKSLRLWGWSLQAGLVSLATFWLLNPWWSIVLRDFQWQIRYYDSVATGRGSSHGQVLWDAADFLFRHHGLFLVGALALGTCALLWRIVQRWGSSQELAMVLGFFLGYSALYAGVTELFLGQNYLLVIPFTSLIAAWTLVCAWRFLAGRISWIDSRWMRGLVACGVCIASFYFPVKSTYLEVVPTTSEVASERLQDMRLRAGSVVYYEGVEDPLDMRRDGHWIPALRFESLQEVEEARLSRADAELFPASRLEEEGDFYLRRIVRPEVRAAERISPRRFVARGPELVLLHHLWRPKGEPLPISFRPLTEDGRCGADLSTLLEPGDIFSLWIRLPQGRKETELVEPLEKGISSEVMYRTRANEEQSHFMSQRFEYEVEENVLSLDCSGESEIAGDVVRWSRERG